MALKIFQPGLEPCGQFCIQDGYDILGGEIVTVCSLPRTNTLAEHAAFDARQGYTNDVDKKRLGVVPYMAENGLRPLWLADEGSSGYGTLFGQQISSAATFTIGSENIGPNTMAGSGKITIWNKPGIYGVTTDAVDTHASLGLVPANGSLRPGVALYPMSNGKMTPTASRAPGGALGADVVGRFLQFCDSSVTLVNTPKSLVDDDLDLIFVLFEFRIEG